MGTVHPIRRARPPAETGCLCESTAFTCNQGRTCPYRQPSPDDEDAALSWVWIVVSLCASVCTVSVVLGPQVLAWVQS